MLKPMEIVSSVNSSSHEDVHVKSKSESKSNLA